MSAAGAVTTDLVDSATYAKESQDFRHQIGHVSRHSSVFLLGTVFAGISGYLFKIYLAREIGPEALGLYALGMTMVGFVGIFSEVGLPQAAVRFVAAYSATGRWRELATFLLSALALLMAINLLCAGVLATAGRWLAVHFYHAPELAVYMWMFAGLAFFAGMNTFFGHVLAGYKHISRRTIITNFVSSPVSIGLTVLLVSLGTGLWGYSIAQLITSSVAFVLLSASLWKLRPRAAFNGVPIQLRLEREVITFSALAFGAGFLEFLIAHADKVIIGIYLDPRSLGIYTVAAAFVSFIPILLHSVNQIFAPVMADLHARGELRLLERMFQTLTKWIVCVTVPAGVLVILFARPLMGIFGQAFAPGWPILVIGTIAQLINSGVGSVGYLLLMCGHQRRLVRVQIISAILILALSLALSPRLGIVGAAVAAAGATIASNLMCLMEVRRSLAISPYNRHYVRIVPAVLASCASLFQRS